MELGLPAALLLCGGVLAWLVWSRPWRETDPVRQLAWGVVAVVGLHSLLEYPLWYGPFQVTTLFALVLLWWRRAPGRGVPEAWRWLGSKLGDVTVGWGLGAAVCLIGAAGLGMAAYQYRVVSQLYKPVAQRPPALRDVRAVPQPKGVLFSDQVRFAWLTTQDLTPANAAQMHAVALDLLHFSPEPRVIEKVVDGALALGRADEAALHQQRYRIAYLQTSPAGRHAGRLRPVQPARSSRRQASRRKRVMGSRCSVKLLRAWSPPSSKRSSACG